MVECGNCHNQVIPIRKISWLLFGTLLLMFWPGAVVYFAMNKKNICPRCRIPVVRPPPRAPARPLDSEPVAPKWDFYIPIPQWSKGTWLKIGAMLVGGIVVGLVIATTGGDGGDDNSVVVASKETSTTASAPPVGVDDGLAEIANHSGRYVKWYLGKVTRICYDEYSYEYCLPEVYKVIKGGECGAILSSKVGREERNSLPDGQFYFMQLVDAWGGVTGYRAIASGSRYGSLPRENDLFACWLAQGKIKPLW